MFKLWKKFQKLKKFVDGYKTYITAVGVAILAVLQYLGYTIDPWIWKLLGALGLGSIRSAWKKLEK